MQPLFLIALFPRSLLCIEIGVTVKGALDLSYSPKVDELFKQLTKSRLDQLLVIFEFFNRPEEYKIISLSFTATFQKLIMIILCTSSAQSDDRCRVTQPHYQSGAQQFVNTRAKFLPQLNHGLKPNQMFHVILTDLRNEVFIVMKTVALKTPPLNFTVRHWATGMERNAGISLPIFKSIISSTYIIVR